MGKMLMSITNASEVLGGRRNLSKDDMREVFSKTSAGGRTKSGRRTIKRSENQKVRNAIVRGEA